MEQILRCENLWKWYPSPDGRLDVLRGLDLEVNYGDFVAVVGASGVGKSTLLHILGLLDLPSDGLFLFRGRKSEDIGSSAAARIRANEIGFVFQFHHLLPEFTAMENLLIPSMIAARDGAEAREHAEELMAELGLVDRMKHFPAQLSGGEQQRIALARALMNYPKLLIADEPTGNLDSKNAEKFMELAGKMREKYNLTIILATHNMTIARYADAILRLKDGKLHPEK